MDDPITLIEQCFQTKDDDTDFSSSHRADPFSVIGPPPNGGRIIYTTKARPVASALSTHSESQNLGLIGRYGLPKKDDVAWIRTLVGTRDVLFLGDMDPVDLMIFAWLRQRLHPIRVAHLGINDEYLDALQVVVPKKFMIKLHRSERESLPTLKRVLPDMAEILGPRCGALLKKNLKIELEAVVSAKGSVETIIPPPR